MRPATGPHLISSRLALLLVFLPSPTDGQIPEITALLWARDLRRAGERGERGGSWRRDERDVTSSGLFRAAVGTRNSPLRLPARDRCIAECVRVGVLGDVGVKSLTLPERRVSWE
jgi:hypothetical protein